MANLGGGLYGKGGVTADEKAEKARQADEWFRKKLESNYRQIVVEAPGKMVLALGKMAQEQGTPFGDFVEGILAEYLEAHRVNWK